MHTLAAKFGAFALAPFLFFGANHGQLNQMFRHPATSTPPSHHVSVSAPVSITGVDGPASLAVNTDGTWTVDVNSASTTTNLQYSVKWGDEASGMAPMLAAMSDIQSSATFTHEYVSAGTYYPDFTVTDQDGHSASKTVTVTVTDAAAAPHLDSVSPTSGAVGTSATLTGTGFDASSTVTVGGIAATGVALNADGTISFDIPSLATGTYNIRVHDGSDRSNAVSFQVTAAAPSLSISGVDAPVTLAVGTSGTWTVHAATDSGSLHYSVVWGDEPPMASMLRALGITVDTSSTFTHTYETAGTYTPTFTVSDDSGHSESVSASVVVE